MGQFGGFAEGHGFSRAVKCHYFSAALAAEGMFPRHKRLFSTVYIAREAQLFQTDPLLNGQRSSMDSRSQALKARNIPAWAEGPGRQR
jgi:hypothetical protein